MGTIIGVVFALVIWGWGLKLLLKSYHWGNSEWIKSWILFFGSLFYFLAIAPIILLSGYIIMIIAIIVFGIVFILDFAKEKELKTTQEQELINIETSQKSRTLELDNFLNKHVDLALKIIEQKEKIDEHFTKYKPVPYRLYTLDKTEYESIYAIIHDVKYSNLINMENQNANSLREIMNGISIVSQIDEDLRIKKLYLLLSTADNKITFYIKKLS